MDFKAIVSKLKKYPTAAAALVFSAVFSFLLAPEKLLGTIDFYLVWGLSALFAIHIWCNFKEDRSYKVSGIVPAWLELIAGTLLLFFCPVREISLIFIMLAVCSYAAGIIFSVKVTPVDSKVVFVLRRMVKAFPRGNAVSFSSMIREQGDRSDRVATFLAILELIRSGRISYERTSDDYIIRLNLERKGGS